MIFFDACLSFNIAERQQGETAAKRLNCFIRIIMFVLNNDHRPRKLTIWWNVQLYDCTASVYTKQLPTINLLSSSSGFTAEQPQQAHKMTAFQEAPLRLQLTNQLIFIFQGRVQMCQPPPSCPKRGEWWKAGVILLPFQRYQKRLPLRLKQELTRGEIIKYTSEHRGYDRKTNSRTFKLMVITQPLYKLTLLEEQAVPITDCGGHGPWSCTTVYADASMKPKDDGIGARVSQQTRKKRRAFA